MKNAIKKEVAEPSEDQKVLEHILISHHQKATEANRIAENHLQATARNSKILENSLELQSRTHKKISELSSKLEPKEIEDGATFIIKGKRGKDGHTPTEAELLKLIKPLIPKVKDGHTPTKRELLDLIIPLIPKVKDGETPGDARLLTLIRTLMPKEKPGKLRTAKQDTPEELVAKLKGLIKWEDIAGRPNIETYRGKGGTGPGFLREISDMAIDHIGEGQSIRKQGDKFVPYDPATAGSGFNIETPTGAINGSNTQFTVTHTPKAVILNGAMYFEGDGYTFDAPSMNITMLVVPMTGSTLRSAY